jgi:predicted transcriptional regulator
MLIYETKDDSYVIHEIHIGQFQTVKLTTIWEKDLKRKRVSNELWRQTDQQDKDWFIANHLKHFVKD